MNNIEFVRKTPYGDIVVIPTGTDDEYPGIVVEFDGEVVARVEYNEYDKGLAVMSWYKGNEDYSSKLVSKIEPEYLLPGILKDKDLLNKIEDVKYAMKSVEELDGIKAYLTTNEILDLARKLNKYDYSDYNDYVADLIREEIYDGKKW